MSRKPRTLRATLTRALVQSVVSTAALGVGFAAVSSLTPDAVAVPGGDSSAVMEGRAPAPHAPGTVLAKHADQCWTASQEAKAQWPSHAVVQFKDGTTVYTGRKPLVDAAFNEALASIGYADHLPAKDVPFEAVIALCE